MMNNKIKFLAVGLAAFVIGMGANNFALSDVPTGFKVAIVDVPQVVASSAQVQALKKDQEAKAKEITSYIEKARKDVAATTDEKKKKALEEKYTKDLLTKRSTIEKDYSTKLQEIDKNISAKIEAKAKADGYSLVLAKTVVLYGGTDITQDMVKAVK